VSGIYDVTLANNAATNLAVLGSFAKIYAAPAGQVQIKLDGGEGYALLEGQGVRLRDGKTFRDVQVTNRSGATQTIQVFIGDSDFEDTRITGNVKIVDAVGTGVHSYNGSDVTNQTFTVSQTIVAPATNVNGIIVRTTQCTVKAGAAGNSQGWLIAAPSAPAGIAGTNILVLCSAYDQDQTVKTFSTFDLHKLVPTGWGIYFCTQNIIAAAVNGHQICLEVL
jgi:hypothetical protein